MSGKQSSFAPVSLLQILYTGSSSGIRRSPTNSTSRLLLERLFVAFKVAVEKNQNAPSKACLKNGSKALTE